ncbi:MAG: NAD(P)H-hydrate dehydratase [Fimbriimonadaceae bacterium]
MWIATAERSKEIDRKLSDEFGIPTRVLMERAGLSVFDAVRQFLPDGGALAILCGKGNNGGDGFVVARLAYEHGYDVVCLVSALPEQLSADAEEQMRVTRAQGVIPIFYGDARWQKHLDCLGRKDLIIDALLGTGADGCVQGPVKDMIQAINRSGVPVVSVDVPSGIHTDTGEELSESVWALRTVTFGLPKPYLFQGIGLEHSGFWTVADIGIPSSLLNEPTGARLLEGDWVGNLIPERMRGSHKGENGSLLVVAGSERMPGAANMVAKAALRSGAGLVTVASIDSVCDAVAAQLPEAILLRLPEQNGKLHPDAANVLLEAQSKFSAAVVGPGLTHDEPVQVFLRDLFEGIRLPTCIDADALNAISLGVELPKAECVLTPHPGEMSRLLHGSVAEIQSDRFRTVREAVQQYRSTVLLKGSYSIVGDPDNPMAVNCTGNPGMAAAGMGDVLSGVIGTLLSQDLPPYHAACCGMFWHGLAGDLCAQEIGTVGFLAGDVANALPQARAKITTSCCPR